MWRGRGRGRRRGGGRYGCCYCGDHTRWKYPPALSSCIYMYIYIKRERERKKREKSLLRCPSHIPHTPFLQQSNPVRGLLRRQTEHLRTQHSRLSSRANNSRRRRLRHWCPAGHGLPLGCGRGNSRSVGRHICGCLGREGGRVSLDRVIECDGLLTLGVVSVQIFNE